MPLLDDNSYRSPIILANGHLQTIVPNTLRKVRLQVPERERLRLPDHDFLDLDWYGNGNARLAILSHGLEGDSKRPYILGMVRALYNKGFDVLAWNYRGCSGEINQSLHFYHSGATADLEAVIKHVTAMGKYSELHLIGFSLGGNITLKYLGEKGSEIDQKIKSGLAFSVPIDLAGSSAKIDLGINKIYSRRFIRNLAKKVRAKAPSYPADLDEKQLYKVKTLRDFDELFTAPIHGFLSAEHYYGESSALGYLKDISTPTLLINAKNDPMLSAACYPYELAKEHKHLHFMAPETGGHCGFSTWDGSGVYWSERKAVEWLEKHSEVASGNGQ